MHTDSQPEPSPPNRPKLDLDNTQVAFTTKSDGELLKAYTLFGLMNNNKLVEIGSNITLKAFKWNLPITPLVEHTIYEQFCGGKNVKDAMPKIEQMYEHSVYTFLDYGVEGKNKETQYDAIMQQLLTSIRFAASHKSIPTVIIKVTALASNQLLEKINRGDALSEQEQAAEQRVLQRLNTLCSAALQTSVILYIDAEESWMQDTLDQYVQSLMQQYNQQEAIVYNTVQLYRHDKLAYLKRAHQHALDNNYILGVKLVRGAYMEKERARAAEMGYPSPIQHHKQATDNDYNAALRYCIDHVESIAFCNATHNEKSNQLLAQLIDERGLSRNHKHIWFAQLYGMSDAFTYNLARAGYNTAKYLPYGPVKEVVPYLIRRAQENTSVSGQTSRELKLLTQEMKRRKLKH